MVIVLNHWTVGHLCRALNEMDLRVVVDTSAGNEGLYLPEYRAVGHDGPTPSIVDYGQQQGCCRQCSIEQPDRHTQDLVPYENLVVMSVPSL